MSGDARSRADLRRARHVLRGLRLLRVADHHGRLPEVVGDLRVTNRGRMVLGERFRASAGTMPSKIETWAGGLLEIGDHAFLNFGVDVLATSSVTIGDNVRIAPLVSVVDDAMHETSPGDRRRGPIVIGDDVWLGRGVVVLPGVTIGDHAVVAAGSVVTRDLPAKVVAGGVPAKVIRALDVPDEWRRV